MNEVEQRDLASSQRRLQREADFTGSRLSSFRAVAYRHGVPGALLGLACFALPGSWSILESGLAQAIENPLHIICVSIAIFFGLGTSDVTSEGDAKGMGKAIAAAVQRELLQQKRPGGMLSPYGGTR